MCWSTGRAPMAQPPGSETARLAEARQQRARAPGSRRASSSPARTAPRASVDARRRRASPSTRPRRRARRRRPFAQQLEHGRHVVQLRHVGQRQRLGASAAPRRGSAAPRSWRRRSRPRLRGARPPRIRSLSMVMSLGLEDDAGREGLGGHGLHCTRHPPPPQRAPRAIQWWCGCGRAGVPLGGGERLHRQRVDLLAHSIAQRRIDALVSLHPAGALERGGDDGGEEVPAVAFDLQVLASQPGGDEILRLRSAVGSAMAIQF